jgi:hypothetical protein
MAHRRERTFFPPSPPRRVTIGSWEVVSSYSSATAPGLHGISRADPTDKLAKNCRQNQAAASPTQEVFVGEHRPLACDSRQPAANFRASSQQAAGRCRLAACTPQQGAPDAGSSSISGYHTHRYRHEGVSLWIFGERLTISCCALFHDSIESRCHRWRRLYRR